MLAYEATIPTSIAALLVGIPAQLAQRISEVEVSIARFDTAQAARGYALPALLVEQPVVVVAREDVPLIAKAAIFHAQFEAIRPFSMETAVWDACSSPFP